MHEKGFLRSAIAYKPPRRDGVYGERPDREHEYIYGLVDPRARHEIRYVGRTTVNLSDRLLNHYNDRAARPYLNKSRWLTGLKIVRLRAEIVLLELTARNLAGVQERFWTDHYRGRGHRVLSGAHHAVST